MADLYSAVVINEIAVDGPGHIPNFEESIVVLLASSDEEASAIAERFARDAEHTYLNEDGETVRWRFRELVAVWMPPADDLSPAALVTGAEVHSRFFGDLDAYRAMSGSPDEARWTPECAP